MKTARNKKRTKIDHQCSGFQSVVVAAGQGIRAGGKIPKQYRLFLGKPVFIHSLAVLVTHSMNRQTVLVHPPGDADRVLQMIESERVPHSHRITLVEGGTDRASSVRNGLAVLDNQPESSILLHDAARPGLTHADIDLLLAALEAHEGAAPALQVVDALKRYDGTSVATVSRDNLYRIQTPQAFRSNRVPDILAVSTGSPLDEFELAENAGLELTLTEGSERLAKLTHAEDFLRMEAILCRMETRTGMGYDVHAFEVGEQVTLCGVEIPHIAKLKGHSDADVAWHALTDALLGALGAGDIGDHFPPSDDQWKGAASSVFLEFAGELVRKRSGRIVNVDVTLICEAPKIKLNREAMKLRTAEVLKLDPDRVSIKATTTEGLGFEGRREGIAAQAVANIELPPATRHE